MDNNYQVEYYKNSQTGKEPVKYFLLNLPINIRAKIFSYIGLLQKEGRLKYPYARHVVEKIWELRVDFASNYHRIFYFIFTGKRIVLLHAFTKKTDKTPAKELNRTISNYKNFINNN
jgi:phage-related protein